MSPIVDTASLSKTGVHVVPLLVVFQTPPAAQPAKPMLGYPTCLIFRILRVNRHSHARIFSVLQFLLPIVLNFSAPSHTNTNPAKAQQIRPPAAKGGIAELSAKGPQRRQGNLFIADDAFDTHYADQRLRADHIAYNDQTTEALSRGHVQFYF